MDEKYLGGGEDANVSSDIQKEEEATKDFDRKFLNIYSDLTSYLLDNVKTSVGQVLELAESFLNEDASKAINDFHALYEADSELDTHKEVIGKSVDKIVDFIQNSSEVDEKKEREMLDELDTFTVSAERLSYSSLQKDIEALVTLESDVKDKVVPILHGLQFEDQLSQSITSICKAMNIIIELIHAEDKFSPKVAADLIYRQLACEKDRVLFCTHVLGNEYEGESVANPEYLQRLLAGKEESVQIAEFIEKIESFTSASLHWNSQESERSVSLIVDTICIVQQRVEQLFEPTPDNKETVAQLMDVSNQMQDTHNRKTTLRLLVSTLNNRMEADHKIKKLIEPIVTAIQFHDRICQNMDNLSHALETWRINRNRVIECSSFSDELQVSFGTTLIDLMTMTEERDIVRRHIQGLPEACEDSGDDVDLF